MPIPGGLPRVQILDAVTFGNLVIDWALYNQPRPADMAAFRAATAGTLDIPPEITGLVWADTDIPTLYIKLPNQARVRESVQFFTDNPAGSYPLPAFYSDSSLSKR